ncbi:MAG: response regulator [Acidobacteriota bacterium]|nr:response regulator [Acidobacteriota bacterium]
MTGKVLAVMSDLFFSVKINDAAKRLGASAEFVKDKTLAIEKAKLKPPLMILDLNSESPDPLDLIAQIKADPDTAGIPMIGFVSHVQTQLRQRALELGCDTVVARSVFAQNLPAMLETALSAPVREVE